MTTLRAFASLIIIVTTSLPGCGQPRPPVTARTSDATTPDGEASARQPADLNNRVVAAIQTGRYVDAVELARLADVSKAEVNLAVGELILQSHADGHATQVPRESVEDGLRLIEQAALAGHQQAISSMAATFHTGLRDARDAFLIQPEPPSIDAGRTPNPPRRRLGGASTCGRNEWPRASTADESPSRSLCDPAVAALTSGDRGCSRNPQPLTQPSRLDADRLEGSEDATSI